MGNKKEMKATTNVAAKTKTTFATTINNKVARDDTQLECCQKIIRKFSPAYACDTVRCFGCEQRVCCECCTCRQFSIFLPLSPSAVCFKHDSIHNCTIVIACSPHTWNLFKRIRCALFCNLCTTKIYAQDVQVACFSSLVFFSCFAALLSFSECVGNGLTPLPSYLQRNVYWTKQSCGNAIKWAKYFSYSRAHMLGWACSFYMSVICATVVSFVVAAAAIFPTHPFAENFIILTKHVSC